MERHLLSSGLVQFLAGFCDIRFDALCEYVAETEGIDEPRDEAVLDLARGVLTSLEVAARWTEVPPKLRTVIENRIWLARRMWEVDGAEHTAVRRYVEVSTPAELVDFVLLEAYRDEPATSPAGFDDDLVAAEREAGLTTVRDAPAPGFQIPPSLADVEVHLAPAA